ncbi:S-layer homology domain-containing protein [Paenibacillus illinoisensis]|uniref:S-layer homology domain-containing protein n=1 Tax=Paenibacillus illinoisensis TaxID=59845 RepID=UPI001C8DB42B|nr:S-layer homology domain-containing protein [Paenibacillus illinoisensis]MBY0217282.1 S-layer homology domain-containing protein [Paenibacillus illinoisensis]
MKKILSVALSTAMAFSMFASVAFGDTAVTPQQQFDALKAKGIFNGYPDGTAGLDKEMTRAEFAKVITKLLGLKEITGVYSYNDKNYNAKNWAAPYIEAVTAAGIMEGKNVEKKIFDFNGKVTIAEMATILTRALDLEIPTETNNSAAAWAKGYVQAAINAGLIDANANFSANASRELLVGAAYSIDQAQSLKVTSYTVSEAGKVVEFKISDGETVKVTLDKALEANKETEVKFTYKDKEFTEKVTYVVTAATKLETVSASNLKEVTVKFDGKLDEKTAEDTSNYSFDEVDYTFESATLSEDGSTVTLLLDDSSNVFLTNQEEYTLNIEGVKNADSSKTFSESKAFTPVDTVLPEVTEVKGLGTKAFRVEFSEPVKESSVNTTSNFKIDGKAISGYVSYAYPNVAIISTDLSVGEHTLTVSNVEDYNNFKNATKDIKFTVAEDTTAPQVTSVKTTDLKVVEVTFDEPVKSVSSAYQTSSSKTADTITVNDNKVTLTFSPANQLSLGSNTVFLTGVTDYSNNSADRQATVDPTLDTERPTVASVKAAVKENNHVFTIEFSKDVNDEDVVAANFTLKDSDGDVVQGYGFDSEGHPLANGLELVSNTGGKKYTLTTIGKLPADTYTLEIANIRDTAAIKNTMLPYSTKLNLADVSNPAIAGTWYEVPSNNSERLNIYVQYDKAIAVSGTGNATDVNKYSYKLQGSNSYLPLPVNSSVTAVNAETVRISLPAKDGGYVNTGDQVGLQIVNIADVNGNYLVDTNGNYVVTTTVKAKAENAIGVVKATATSKTRVKVEFDGLLSSVNANDFKVDGQSLKTVSTTTDNGHSIVTFDITGDELTVSDPTSVLFTSVDSPKSVNAFGIPVKGGESVNLKDGIAPASTSAPLIFGTDTVTGATYAVVTFDEAVKVANNTTGFLVYVKGQAATVTAVDQVGVDADQARVVFTSDNLATGNNTVEVYLNSNNSSAKYVTDIAGNAATSAKKTGTYTKN